MSVKQIMLPNLGTDIKNSKRTSIITEQYKDTVYFSGLLAQDYPNEYRQLKEILDKNGIRNDVLHATKDYWCRDYMPVQRCYNNFVQFKYDPDYLKGKSQFRTDAIPVLNSLTYKVNNKQSFLVVDGGNVTVCEKSTMTNSRTYADNNEVVIVMTEKIFSENPQFSREEVLHFLHEDFMGTEVLLLPWDKEDICGHTDGIVHNIGKGKILVNLNLYPAQVAQEMRKRLGKTFEVIDLELSKYHPYSWAYINLLQTRDLIIVPGLGLSQDKEALEQIKSLHPEYEDRIYQINLASIIKKWNGALNCLSWTISTEMSKLHHSEELDKKFKSIVETTNKYALPHEDILFAGNYNPTHLPNEIEKLYFGF